MNIKMEKTESIKTMLKRMHIYISGRVQGVYFRQFALKISAELGVKGWIKNLADGRVEAVVEGEAEAVDKFVDWCKKGPSFASVANLESLEEKHKGEFDKFNIKY